MPQIKLRPRGAINFLFVYSFWGVLIKQSLNVMRQFRQTVPAVSFFWVEGLLITHNL